MKGCLTVVGAAVLLLILVVVIGGILGSGSGSSESSSSTPDFSTPKKSGKHGWITVAAMEPVRLLGRTGQRMCGRGSSRR